MTAELPWETRTNVHARYRASLEQLLASPAPPRDDELTRAIYAVFDPASLADAETRRLTEPWLAALICRTAPRSDVIIDRAAAAFGWKHLGGDIGDPAIAAVVARLAARREADRFGRLEDLLRGADQPGENVLMGALDKVTDPRVIGDPAEGPRIEAWLARLLLQTRPRSDPLIAIATRRLNWGLRSHQFDPAIATVAGIAAQSQAPTSALAPAGASPRARDGPLGYWLAGALVAGLLVVASLLVLVAVNSSPPRDYASGGGAPPAQQGSTASAAPQVAVSDGRVEITLASTETSDTYIRCDQIAASSLQGCRIERSTMSDDGHGALDFVRRLRLDPSADSDRSVEVHVHWKDMS